MNKYRVAGSDKSKKENYIVVVPSNKTIAVISIQIVMNRPKLCFSNIFSKQGYSYNIFSKC